MSDEWVIKKAEDAVEKDLRENEDGEKRKVSISFVKTGNLICEEVFDRRKGKPQFAVWDGKEVTYKDFIEENEVVFSPFADEIVFKRLVKLPTKAEEYGSETQLFNEICQFLHKYVDLDEEWETWAVYYVLLSWVYDKLPVIPYLCALGPSNTGKTRLAQVVGAICYKPFLASGSITASPIFRILDRFHGTLVINEFEQIGQLYSEIIVVLNNGYDANLPAVRVEGEDRNKVKAFHIFGPKIFTSRKRKEDWAFESRLLTIRMREARRDVPPFLTESFYEEAQSLTNKLLLFRFKHFDKPVELHEDLFRNIKGRLRQTLLALTSVIKDDAFLQKAIEFGKQQEKELETTRGFDLDAFAYQELKNLYQEGSERPTVKEVTEKIKESAGTEKLTPKAVGKIIRDELGFETKRIGARGAYCVLLNAELLQDLAERYEQAESSVSSESSNQDHAVTERTEFTEHTNGDAEKIKNVQPEELEPHLQKFTDDKVINEYEKGLGTKEQKENK